MKQLLFHFDTDPIASVFDTVVAYDGGAGHVVQSAGVSAGNCVPLVEGLIYTRPPKSKKYTALFISGSDLEAGQQLMAAVRKCFHGYFRVSVMLDSNGCNTTAAAGVALLASGMSMTGKMAVVLAGTGPVGQRAAVMMAQRGAHVRLTSRRLDRAREACNRMRERFGVTLTPMAVADVDSTLEALEGAHIVFGAGKAGVQLLSADQWQQNPTLEALADVNNQPPFGFEGIDMMDKATERHGKLVFGGIGIGALKLKLHRACIARLFERNDQILDAEEIFSIAESIAVG